MSDHKKIDDIQQHSEQVRDVLSETPNILIRTGSAVIFGFVIVGVLLSWFIKYPDVITGKIILSTQNPPIQIITKSNGKVTHLYQPEGSFVEKNQPIAQIESLISKEGISYLESLIPTVEDFLKNTTKQVVFTDSSLVFGTIQLSYNELKDLCYNYRYWIENESTYSKKSNHVSQSIAILKTKIKRHKRLILISQSQEAIARKELYNAQIKYNADQILYEKGVLSKMDFYNQETLFREKQQQLESLKKTVTQHQIDLDNLEQQLLDMEYEMKEKNQTFQRNIQVKIDDLKNQIDQWRQNFTLAAPISGELSYLKPLSTYQFVTTGESLFTVIPKNESFIGFITIPSGGYGKVNINQQVKIKFDNYPYHEYGQVEGRVTKISKIATENNYRVEIQLINGLNTSYEKTIVYKPEMSGVAEIITEDLRLLERIFYQFKKIME